MFGFFSKDFISLLAGVLLLGGILLLVLVIRNLVKGEDKKEEGLPVHTQEKTIISAAPATQAAAPKPAVPQAPQTTLSQELNLIKSQLAEIQKTLQNQAANTSLKDEVEKISHKMDVLYNALSSK